MRPCESFLSNVLLQGCNAAIMGFINSHWEVMDLKRELPNKVLWLSVMQEVRPYEF